MESTAVADSSAARIQFLKDSLLATQALAMTKDLKNEAVLSTQPSASRNSGAGSQSTITAEGEIVESDREAQLADAKSSSLAAKEEKSQVTPLEISDDKKEIVTKPSEVISASEIGLERKKERARSSSPIQMVHGKVTSSDDRSPLPGVNVIVKATGEGVVTDTQGNYMLLTELQNPQLVFSFIGRQTQEARATGTSALDIEMIEDVTQLSEVVVTEMSLEKTARDESLHPPVVKMAAPLGGMRAYNKYLENSLKYPKDALEKKIKGKVTVQFTVTTTGSLTEFSVLKGIGHGCDEEVIRIVKEGPRWTPTTQDDVAVESEVKVKMKFDPEKVRDK
jgi:TonB family protein